MIGRFAAEWEKFAVEHVPIDASDAQREATKIAFYHGAGAFLDLLMAARRERPTGRLAAFSELQDELSEFNEALIAKYPVRRKKA